MHTISTGKILCDDDPVFVSVPYDGFTCAFCTSTIKDVSGPPRDITGDYAYLGLGNGSTQIYVKKVSGGISVKFDSGGRYSDNLTIKLY